MGVAAEQFEDRVPRVSLEIEKDAAGYGTVWSACPLAAKRGS